MRIVRFVDKNDDPGQDTEQGSSQGGSSGKKFRLWSSKDNRIQRAPRFLISFETEIKLKKFFSAKVLGVAETVNISISGAKIMFPEAIGFGTKLTLKIADYSSNEFINVDANVVRCRRNYLGGSTCPVFEIGISFKNMSRRKAAKLMKWVEAHERFGEASFVR